MANILSACVNSAGSQANGGSNTCSTLESAAVSSNGTVPTNTVDVVLNMAHLPGQSVATLYNLQPPTPPFQPTLSGQPQDWTVSLVYGPSCRPQRTTAGWRWTAAATCGPWGHR